MKNNVLRSLNFLLYFFIFVPLLYFFIFVPILKIEISSNINSVGQIFYKVVETGGYSGNFSYSIDIVNKFQKIEVELPSYKDPIRIDIADEPYNIVIHKIYVSLPLLNTPLELIGNQYQIEQIEHQNSEIKIRTVSNARDPQLFFIADTRLIEKIRIIISIILGFLITIIILFINNHYIRISDFIISLEGIFYKFYNKKNEINFNLTFFGVYFGIAVVFHLFEISNFLISIDDEYSAFRTAPEAWISDGRWSCYLIEKFIFDQPTMPFVPNLLSCALMALSYMLILGAHKIQQNWKVFILFPIYVSFPTLWTINEFYGNMVIVAFGFLMVASSLMLFTQENETSYQGSFFLCLKKYFIPSLFLAIAIGAYQSFIMLAFAMGLGIYILKIMNSEKKESFSLSAKYFLKLVFYLGYSLIIYMAISKSFKWVFPSEQAYVDGFIKIHNVDYILVVKYILKEIVKLYSGSSLFFGVSISSLSLLSIFAIFVFIYKKSDMIVRLIIIIMLFISPFLLHFLAGGNALPTRSMVAVPYIFWIFSVLVISQKRIFANIIGILIIGTVVIQMLSTLGQYAAVTQIGQTHDRILAADLYRRIAEVNPKFNRSEVAFIDIYGYKNIETIYPNVPTSTVKASFFDWDGGNISRMLSYMKLIGYTNLHYIGKDKIREHISQFQKMPSWPNKNSVQFINEVYLIKLGDKPDLNHIIGEK